MFVEFWHSRTLVVFNPVVRSLQEDSLVAQGNGARMILSVISYVFGWGDRTAKGALYVYHTNPLTLYIPSVNSRHYNMA